MQEVEAVCDRVIIINKGKIVANDSLKNLQKNKTNQFRVRVLFQENITRESLQKLDMVDMISNISGNEFLLSTSHPELVRKQLLALTIAKNLNIVSLQTEGNSLEDVFRELTK